jgi:phosphoserine phosphatase
VGFIGWWARGDSNPGPPPCKGGVLTGLDDGPSLAFLFVLVFIRFSFALHFLLGGCCLERVVVFDVDGVLVDSSARFRACLEEVGLRSLAEARGFRRRVFWECFLSSRYIYLDRVRVEYASLARSYAERGFRVVVVTGRPRSMEVETLAQLREAGLEGLVSEVFFRGVGDYRGDSVFKVEVLRRLMSRYVVEVVYDDSEDVVEALRREFPGVKVVLVPPP